jgi:hypothetical protein
MISSRPGGDQDKTGFEVRHDVSTRDGDLSSLEMARTRASIDVDFVQ